MGYSRLILPLLLTLACVSAGALSYRRNDTLLLCGWDGQINAVRSERGYVAVVVSRHSLGSGSFGVMRHVVDSPTQVGSTLFLSAIAITSSTGRSWGPTDVDAIAFTITDFAHLRDTREHAAFGGLAIASERADDQPTLLSGGAFISWWYPIGLSIAWLLLATRPVLRDRHRKRHGLCAVCGYDLRQSAGGCPECGDGREGGPQRKEKHPMRTAKYAATCFILVVTAFIAGRTMGVPKAPALSADVSVGNAQMLDTFRDVRIKGVPLDEAARTLSKLYGCEIRVDVIGLEKSGLESDRRVSFAGDNVNLMTAVRGLGTDEGLRGYFAVELRGDDIVLTAAAYASANAVVRVYDVENLVLLRMAAKGILPTEEQSRDFDLWRTTAYAPEAEKEREWLQDTILDKFAPGTWIDDGGQIASMAMLDSYLIVRQSPDVQIAIAAFLNDLFENDLKRLENRKELIRLLQQAEDKRKP